MPEARQGRHAARHARKDAAIVEASYRPPEDHLQRFPLAPMSGVIKWLTVVLLLIPVGLLAGAFASGARAAFLAPALYGIIVAGVWLWSRPTCFEASPGGLSIVWPLRRRRYPREELASARIVETKELKQLLGFALRIGVGGMWGVFGWLWSARVGLVATYITRTDRYVLIERRDGKLILLNPDDPERFVQALAL